MRFLIFAIADYTHNLTKAMLFCLTWISVADTMAVLNMRQQLSCSFMQITVCCCRFFCQTSEPSQGLQGCALWRVVYSLNLQCAMLQCSRAL